MRLVINIGVCAAIMGLSGMVLAFDDACQRIVNADAAKLKSPNWHQRVADSGPDGMTLEFIRTGDKLYAKNGSVWRSMPPGMLKTMGQFGQSGFKLSQCRKVGDEAVAGVPASIYAYTVHVGGSVETGNKVWIGRDGLPYRAEAENVRVTIQYTGVVAPKVGR